MPHALSSDAMTAGSVTIAGDGGDQIAAYLARPDASQPRGGVVVIHHMPGYDRATKEITRRFAELGYDAICPNLHYRDAPGAAPDGAAAYLRALPTSNGRVGDIGYCSGGRQSVLAACELDLDATVDCYGAFVTGTPPEGHPLRVTNLVPLLPQLRCPLLGLFGNDDKAPSPAHVDELERLLREHGKQFEFHRYDDAGHGFFAVNRPGYRVAAANDGWERIAAFFTRNLGA